MIIPFLAFCLVATCNAELRTWTAVNGKEVEAEFVSNEKGIIKLKLKSGKVFEVSANKLSKEDNEFIASLSKPEKINPKLESINYNNLEIREDIIYLKNSDTPYTGKASKFYENGKKEFEATIKNGKKNGIQTHWHENENKKSVSNFKGGKLDGLFLSWYENGQKLAELNFKEGKFEGLHVGWYKNGQKKVETNWKEGKQDGLAVGWHENGLKGGEIDWKDGKKVSSKYWNSKGEPVDSFEEAQK